MKARRDIDLLIVDDQPPMRDTLRKMLKAGGYSKVHTASDGRQAMQIIHASPPDAVLTDWMMPHMTGIELLKTVKSNVELFRLPVLMVTGYASPEKVLYAAEEDVDGFIVKPVSMRALNDILGTALQSVANPDPIQQKYTEMKRMKLSGLFKEALDAGREILNARPHPKAALLACECMCEIKLYDEAIDALEDTNEEDRTSRHSNLLGNIYHDVGKYKLAVLYLEESIKRNPLNHSRKVDLARVYFNTDRKEDAQRLIDGVTNDDPTDLILVEIAQLYLDRNDIEKAGACLEKTVNPIAETVHVFNNYAVALRKAGRSGESAEIYRKCVKIAPNSDILFYNLAFLQNMMGDRTGAMQSLASSLKLNPGSEHARRLLQIVEKN